ncbi:uncharacterized protein LOC131962626 [Centropristis striata]|uniref:uncharacterized protein LOC131962626 n=1 Tax=Centropristis striata TaxID=184440 RepID=UPI0027E05FFC|nr:uncharacterized protein LOC131962626 [Centropristis striata]
MDLLWKILLVCLACAEAENLTVVRVELGKNVTLNCSIPKDTVHWYTEIRSQVRGLIAKTFTSDSVDATFIAYTTLTSKYIAMGNKLVVTNITAEDYRLYYCGRKMNDNITFADTFRLVSVASSNNNTEANCQQHLNAIWQSEPVFYSLLALISLLFSVIISLPFTSETPEAPQFTECIYYEVGLSKSTSHNTEHAGHVEENTET